MDGAVVVVGAAIDAAIGAGVGVGTATVTLADVAAMLADEGSPRP
eukprot:CAMPEP_0205918884 /NCGR_PEP_ID=MMETSP1325-20131115/10077_1 /ASSEMBLY_ACC=CAM_ASM_000708 /TAXON_ID=236786 /ORGANISM="Florenciella sp., Strain RCC1007" /LENGTH=44 /DNA_ID= /DNA_START= /DNA_END= /DNA_ORIENTATION=